MISDEDKATFDRIDENLDKIEEALENKDEPGDTKEGDTLGTDWVAGSAPDRHTVVYIGSPYTHADSGVQISRWAQISQIVALLINEGHWPYSPIAHSHSVATYGNLEGHFDFWQDFDREMIRRTDEFWIALIDGWRDSKGLKAEQEFAKAIGKPVKFVVPVYENPESDTVISVRVHDELPEPWASLPSIR